MPERRSHSRSARERAERLQAAFKPFRSAEASVVDELIAERRMEARKEDREDVEHPSSGIGSGNRPDEPDSRC